MTMQVEVDPFRRWLAAVGEACLTLARELGGDVAPVDHQDAAVEALGPRQRQLFEALARGPADGMKTSDLAKQIEYDLPNAYMALQAMERRGLIQMVPGARPQKWRLVHPLGTSDPYRAAAALVPAGRWTTYGDISLAVRSDLLASRAVASSAMHNFDFPNPERVLKAGGRIAPNWVSTDGLHGPEECRRRLEQQGVRFIDDHADPSQRMTWEELREGLRAAGVTVPALPEEAD
jgi:alkylated DNA nucleotide flippase Atl1